jgi:hypothetical protein
MRFGLLSSILSLGAVACSTASSSGVVADGGAAAGNGGGSCKVAGFTGLVACDVTSDAGAPASCALSLPAQGGISGPLCEGAGPTVCGSAHNDAGVNELDWTAKSPAGGGHFDANVVVTFEATVPVDQLGAFPATIEITQTLPNDGGHLAWKTPLGACTVNFAGSVCLSKIQKRVLSGTGTCSQPAAPETGTSAAAVSIGDFTFNNGS